MHRRSDDFAGAARSAIERGDLTAAAATAQAALDAAECLGDEHGRATALLALAQIDRLQSSIRSAYRRSLEASHTFRRLDDERSEAQALSLLAYSASCLGHNEEAVEAALLGAELAARWPASAAQALAYNDLGVAYFWSRSFDDADTALRKAIDIAQRCEPPVSPYQPTLNLAFAQLVRLATERHLLGTAPTPDAMSGFIAACDALEAAGQAQSLFPGTVPTQRVLRDFAHGIRDAWLGDLDNAREAARAMQPWTKTLGRTTWLQTLCDWLRCEIAWAVGDLATARAECLRTIEVAEQVEHEQLAQLGRHTLAHMLACAGEHAAALDVVRTLKQRSDRIRAESLSSRRRIVQWQLEARHMAREKATLTQQAKHYETLALQDPLTGIANRRAFEERLTAMLDTPLVERMSLALIDIDQFKAVNDRHSHLVGDEVIKAVATILMSHVRSHDLAARLAGDEFVVLFDNATAEVAQQVCVRIQRAIERHDWERVAPGLRVSVSVGAAQAIMGDSVGSLLARSDRRMYAQKRHARSTAPATTTTV